MTSLPAPAQSFVTFAALLRENGFAVAPEQVVSMMEAVTLLGPREVNDLRRAAHALLAPPFERRTQFDQLFNAHFLGLRDGMIMPGNEPDDEVKVQEQDRRGTDDALVSDEINEAGLEAARAEALSARTFAPTDDDATLRMLARTLPGSAPRRRAYRFRRDRRGAMIDLRRSLRDAVRNDGEIFRLGRRARATRPRNVLLLIDVSGSMKTRTEPHLALAHAIAQALDRVEIFTFGTRLTRLTHALRKKNRDQALAEASGIVSDWDGGTRIGDALQAFLSVPRFAGYARGALVVVLSDGLERGDPAAMRDAVARLSRRAWRLSWLSPLAAAPGFKPETEALKAVLPYLDDLSSGADLHAIATHLIDLGRAA